MFKFSQVIIFFLSNLFAQVEIDRNFQGEIDIFNQTENLTCFSTMIEADNYHLYVMNRNDSIYFKKEYDEPPGDIIVSEIYNKIFVRFYDQSDGSSHGESYSYKMYNLDDGVDLDFPALFTKLKLAKGGKYLFASTHLFENGSPLDIYNIETKEHFTIILKDWTKVTSMSGNRLVILQQLSERNKKKTEYSIKLHKNRDSYMIQSRLNRSKYRNGEISETRFFALEDSLSEEYKLFKIKEPKGNSTQLGTIMWIYDLDEKTFNYKSEIKDQNGNIIIMHRDDQNSRSLSVDENDNILINGQRRNSEMRGGRENIILIYDKNFKLLEQKI